MSGEVEEKGKRNSVTVLGKSSLVVCFQLNYRYNAPQTRKSVKRSAVKASIIERYSAIAPM